MLDIKCTYVSKCPHFTGSSLTTEAVTFILTKCKNLKKVNAVKLAQALEMIPSNSKLELIECMPETDRCGFVTATTQKHLKTLAQKCPNLMTLAIFSETDYAPIDWNNNGQILENGSNSLLDNEVQFKNLKHLHTWGGYLQRNIITRLGPQLMELKLVHVEQITLSGAIRDILNCCNNLVKLDLQNCSIKDHHNDHDSVCRYTIPKHKLKHLILVSKCSEIFMNKLLKILTSLEVVEFGTSVALTDQIVESNIQQLNKLKTFKIAHSKVLTIQSIQMFLDNCPDLEDVSDLSSLNNISKMQIEDLQKHLTASNIDVRVA